MGLDKFLKDSLSKAGEMVSSIDVNELVSQSGDLLENTVKMASGAADTVANVSKDIIDAASQKISEIEITPQDILLQALNMPGVKIERSAFLYKELIKYYPEEQVLKSISRNPASVGIPRERIDTIANQVIDYETNKVSAISFAAGIPGGVAMAATIPMDAVQYFGFLLRVMQKLAYLYGFPEFHLDEKNISDETMNQLLIFLGVMFSVNGANQGVRIIAETASAKVSKSLAQKALTKTTLFPIVRKVATTLGFKMTKDVFAKGVSKVVPIVGGVISGGITYATFKPCAMKLKDDFKTLCLSDPEFYKNQEENQLTIINEE